MSATLVSRIVAWVLATLEAMVSLPTDFLSDVINGLVDTIPVVCPAINAYWLLVVALDLSTIVNGVLPREWAISPFSCDRSCRPPQRVDGNESEAADEDCSSFPG